MKIVQKVDLIGPFVTLRPLVLVIYATHFSVLSLIIGSDVKPKASNQPSRCRPVLRNNFIY
jgi:hypothetical protein